MRYCVEESLSSFKFWGGAEDRANKLTQHQFDIIEQTLEEIEPEGGWSDTAINDLFWFEFDTICEWLGYDDEEAFDKDLSVDDCEEAEIYYNDMIVNEDVSKMYDVLKYDNKLGMIPEYEEDGIQTAFTEWLDCTYRLRQAEVYKNLFA